MLVQLLGRESKCHEQVPVNFSLVDITRSTVTEFEVPRQAS